MKLNVDLIKVLALGALITAIYFLCGAKEAMIAVAIISVLILTNDNILE
jgi:hypothetical protein